MNVTMDVFAVLFVYSVLPLSVHSLYPGEECSVNDESGTCMQLSKCKQWMEEIHGVRSIPTHIRKKLQEINCGYEGQLPLICCLKSSNNDYQSDQYPGPFHWGSDHRIEHTNDYYDDKFPSITFHTNNGDDNNKDNNYDNYNSHNSQPHNKPRPTHNENHNNVNDNNFNTQTYRPNSDSNRPIHNTNNENENNYNTYTSRPDSHRPTNNNNEDDNNFNTYTSRPNKDDNQRPTNNQNGNNVNDNKQTPPDIRRHRNLGLLPTNCGVFEDNRIWGGNRTALYEMPWMVLLSYDSPRGHKLSCGATLISKWYLLTAAHCVSHLGKMRLTGGILGEHDIRGDPDCERNEGILSCSPSAVNVTFDRVLPHPGYSTQNLYDDIALLKLSQAANFAYDNIKPICLPTTSELMNEDLTGVQGVVTGWGATEDGIQSPVLLRVELPIVSNSDCQVAYNGDPKIYNRQLCAGGLQDKDSCGGDSGGPLLYPGRAGAGSIRYIQRGVVSFGSKRCGVGGFPGVYTRIAYYMDWILDNLDE